MVLITLTTCQFFILIVWICCGQIFANTHFRFEEMLSNHQMIRLDRSASHTRHEVIFAIKMRNMDKVREILDDISSPDSPSYQKWMSQHEVTSLTRNEEAIHTITTWLDEHHIRYMPMTSHTNYIRATAEISIWENIFQTTFYEWNIHSKTTNTVHRSDYINIPHHISPHVVAILNTCQAIPPIQSGPKMNPTDENLFKSTVIVGDDIDISRLKNIAKYNDNLRVRQSNIQLEATSVTVSFLDTYYYIPSNLASSTQNQSVFSTDVGSGDLYFSNQDLNNFQQTYGLIQQSAIAKNSRDKPICASVDECAEGNLDVQYMMGIAQRAVTYFWHIEASDPFTQYLLDIENEPTRVNSISFVANEQAVPTSILMTFNEAMIRLSSMGVTILAASGDDGVSGTGCSCTTNSNGFGINGIYTGTGYFPAFPASHPYVTAVGATMGINNVVPNLGEGERACQSQLGGVITSGGGFSRFYIRPPWQNQAISTYFNIVSSNMPASGYYSAGRGFPDISLLGVAYETVIIGAIRKLYGTSASAPVLGAMITLINSYRATKGLPSIGPINPTLYHSNFTTGYFNDITSGVNNFCSISNGGIGCNAGFRATAGWDPVTGLGTIYFPKLATMFGYPMNLTLINYPANKENTGTLDKIKDFFRSLSTMYIIIIATIGGSLLILISLGIYLQCIYRARYKARAMDLSNREPVDRSIPRHHQQHRHHDQQQQQQQQHTSRVPQNPQLIISTNATNANLIIASSFSPPPPVPYINASPKPSQAYYNNSFDSHRYISSSPSYNNNNYNNDPLYASALTATAATTMEPSAPNYDDRDSIQYRIIHAKPYNQYRQSHLFGVQSVPEYYEESPVDTVLNPMIESSTTPSPLSPLSPLSSSTNVPIPTEPISSENVDIHISSEEQNPETVGDGGDYIIDNIDNMNNHNNENTEEGHENTNIIERTENT